MESERGIWSLQIVKWAQDNAMIVYEAEGGFKLLSNMAVSSVEGAKGHKEGGKGSKKEAKRE